MFETQLDPEKAVLVGVINQQQDEDKVKEYLDELEFLADTAGAVTLKTFTQKLTTTHPRTFVGEGKLKEIAEYAKEQEADVVIFDDELTPTQLRNIEKKLVAKYSIAQTLFSISLPEEPKLRTPGYKLSWLSCNICCPA